MPLALYIRKHNIFLIALLFFLANFILKILFVSGNEIAMDEPFSIYYAQMDLPSVFRMLKTENNPALHFILLHFWIKLFGIGPFSVRFLSVVFSSLTASVIFLTGKKFFSTGTAIAGALIFTFSLFHVSFSHEARVYSLFVLLTALSLYYFLSLVNRPGSWKPCVALFLVNLLLIYSHYFGFFVVAAELASLFVSGNIKKIWKKLLLVSLLLALAYIPNILVFVHRFSFTVKHGTWVRRPEVTELYGNLNRFLNSRTVMAVLLLIILVYMVLLLRKRLLFTKIRDFFRSPSSRVLLVWFVFPYLAMFFLSLRIPMFLDRYIIYTSVSFYLLIALFISTFSINAKTGIAASALLLGMMIFNFSLAPGNNRRVNRVVQVVRDLKARDPGSIVIISPDYSCLEFTYTYNNSCFRDYNHTISLLHHENIYPLNDFSSFDKTILVDKKVIFVDCDTYFAFGKNPIPAGLTPTHFLVQSFPVAGIYTIRWYKPR
ncbi:MAG: glycosyltransferase family 39 protein [Bacteroidota bacterium]